VLSETERSLLQEVIRLRNVLIKQKADEIFKDGGFSYGISKYEDALPIAEKQLIQEKVI
jgi:hypothetical protein